MSSVKLSADILNAITGYTENMETAVTFVLQTGAHSKRQELVDFLESIASASDKIHFEQRDFKNSLRSPLTFILEKNGQSIGILFSGIPSGHEFNSLILAVLQAGGSPLKLDDAIKTMVANIQEKFHFEVFISLSCHNCPDVVQALNQFALLNDNISSEMIDGGLYPDLIKQRDIQGVPSVYLNGKLFANGKVDISKLMEKLQQQYPYIVEKPTEVMPLQDVVILGGGPAGISAAIYSARKGLKVTLVAERLGGQVKDTMGIENLISVSSTTGPKLTGAMQSHMTDYDVTVKEHLRVTGITQDNIKTVTLSSGEILDARTLIIATGARWRELGVPGEKENIGNGVAYCPHCDGPFFKGKDVAVIGGGNSGIEASLDLAGLAKSVTVFEFAPELKADQILINQTHKRDNISIHTNVASQQIIATNGKVSAIEYQDRATGELHQKQLDGIFVQIGLIPNSQFIGGVVDLTPHGEIIINEHGETSAEGIFACGDVTTVPYKQIIISMGEGAKASLSASDYLLRQPQLASAQDSERESAAA
jgi:alkyl hydroperoxide reductase subunit F